jgi:hypothetical protein
MGIRKKLCLLTTVILSASIFSCGGGGGGEEITSPGLSEEEKALASPEVKETKVGQESLKVVPTSTAVIKDDYAQTSSDVGVIVPVKFGSGEEISNSTETADNATAALDYVQKQFFNAKPPYVVASPKTVKKPIRSFDGKLAVLVDFDSLPMDMTAALANYQSILAIPGNSFNLLKEGYIPYAYYSGDIAFYDSNGKRIWDSSIFSGTNLKIYAVIPQDELSNSTFGSGGDYTLLLLDPHTGEPYSSKEIKVAKKGNSSLTLEAVIDENHLVPFVIAKKAPENIEESSGSIDVPYSINLKAGIIYTNKDGKAVGFGKISGDSYESYYVKGAKGWLSDNETPHVAVVSYILKNGKYELDNYTGGDITIPASAFDPKYVMVDNMTDADKGMLNKFKEGIEWYRINVSDIEEYFYPEKHCPIDEYDAYYNNTLCEDYKNLLSAFLSGNVGSDKGLKDVYTSTNGNCTVVSQTLEKEKLELTLSCVSQGNGTSGDEGFSLTIVREGEKFNINGSDKYSHKWGYKSGNYTEQGVEDYSGKWSYVLILDSKKRGIEGFSASENVSYEELSKEGNKLHESTSASSTAKFKLYKRGKGYLAYVTSNISKEFSENNHSYSLSYKLEETQPFDVDEDCIQLYNSTVVIKNVQFSSTPALPHNISSSSELIITSPDSSTFYVNMSKEPVSSIASGYDLEELLYSAASSNSTEVSGQVTSE